MVVIVVVVVIIIIVIIVIIMIVAGNDPDVRIHPILHMGSDIANDEVQAWNSESHLFYTIFMTRQPRGRTEKMIGVKTGRFGNATARY